MKEKMFMFFTMTAFVCLLSCNIEIGSNNQTEPGKVTFDIDIAAVLKNHVQAGKSRAPQAITGSLAANNLDTNENITFNWYGVIDEEEFTFYSSKTIKLKPGTYNFNMVLALNEFQYIGKTLQYQIVDGQNMVPLTLKPVIGNTITEINLTQVASLKISYPAGELSAITAPSLGIVIDKEKEIILTINPDTGITEQYINLNPGNHTIHLNLYDSSLLIGVSEKTQEAIDVVLTNNIAMDIRPLYGETQFEITTATHEALFIHYIPVQVIEEAGGIENLISIFRITGPKIGSREVRGNVEKENNQYVIKLTLAGMCYDTVDMSLTFYDAVISPDTNLGTCTVAGIALTANETRVTWNLTLRRRAYITGNILAALGINVFNDGFANDGFAEEGVSVFANNMLVGITGSGDFGTKGYLGINLKAGEYIIKALKEGYWGEKAITLHPLQVTNIDITLSQFYRTAKEIKEANPGAEDGVYTIDFDGPGGANPVDVYCDMTTDGGGWIAVYNMMKMAETNASAAAMYQAITNNAPMTQPVLPNSTSASVYTANFPLNIFTDVMYGWAPSSTARVTRWGMYSKIAGLQGENYIDGYSGNYVSIAVFKVYPQNFEAELKTGSDPLYPHVGIGHRTQSIMWGYDYNESSYGHWGNWFDNGSPWTCGNTAEITESEWRYVIYIR